MEEIKCPHCGFLLTADMVDCNICFGCGEQILGASNEPQDLSSEELKQQLERQSEKIAKEKRAEEETARNYRTKDIVVTTADLKQDYEVIGPVSFQINNKSPKSFQAMQKEYYSEISSMQAKSQISGMDTSLMELLFVPQVGHYDFEPAFYIATQELKKRAKILGADAIVGMRQNMNLDTNGFQHFFLMMYGTAVRFIKNEKQADE